MTLTKSAALVPGLWNYTNWLLTKSSKLSDGERETLVIALMACAEWHGNARRKSGHLYVIHPIQVTCLLMDLGCESTVLQAALLHDVLEDTSCTKEQLYQRFGEEVGRLVEAVTLSPVYSKRENLEKLLLRCAEEPRVAMIKLCDRIANLLHGSQLALRAESHASNLEETRIYYLDRMAQLPGVPAELRLMLAKALEASEQEFTQRTS